MKRLNRLAELVKSQLIHPARDLECAIAEANRSQLLDMLDRQPDKYRRYEQRRHDYEGAGEPRNAIEPTPAQTGTGSERNQT
jgi:hypothetical protein